MGDICKVNLSVTFRSKYLFYHHSGHQFTDASDLNPKNIQGSNFIFGYKFYERLNLVDWSIYIG